MSNKKSTKKMGRPKLPKGEAKGKIVPVRFTDAELRIMAKAVKASDQDTLSKLDTRDSKEGHSNLPDLN